MTVVDAPVLHLFATPVVVGAMGVAVWRGVLKRQRAALLLSLFAAMPTILVAVALLSGDGWSLWWYVTLTVPAVLVVVFCLCSLVTNRLSATLQVVCLVILPFFGALVLVEGVGIVFLWSWLLMIGSLGFSSSEWSALDARSRRLHHP
jgi:hypothetical protein